MFQWRFNATTPTARHQGYAQALPYMMNNAFGALGPTTEDNDDDDSAGTVATQVVALTMQSQLTASTVANTMQRQDQLFQHLAQQQTLLHANQHQILDQLAALTFNASDMGQGQRRAGGGRGQVPPAFIQPMLPAQGAGMSYTAGFGGRGHGCGRRSGLT
jgi:hypothetical protein